MLRHAEAAGCKFRANPGVDGVRYCRGDRQRIAELNDFAES